MPRQHPVKPRECKCCKQTKEPTEFLEHGTICWPCWKERAVKSAVKAKEDKRVQDRARYQRKKERKQSHVTQ